MQRLARLAAVGTVAALLFTATPTTVTADDRVTITGTVSATPATGAAEVAIAVKTAPAAGKKSLVADIKGTVIIVTLAPGVAVKRNGVTVPLSDLRANDQVAITIRSRIGTSAPYKYVASKFMATTPNANYAMTVDGYIATAPPEYATSIMVFVKTFSTSKFYPSTNLRNTTIQVALAPGATVTRNGVATTLAGLKLNDRVLLTLTERSGSAAPFTYIASRVVATAANSTLPVTMTGSIVATPASGATTISVYVKTVSNDVGWANDALKGTTVLVGLATGAAVTRDGAASTLGALRLDDRVTLTLTERIGVAAPFTYLASKVVATAYPYLPFTVIGTLVSIPDAGTNRLFVYVKSINDGTDHNAYANGLKGTAIIVSMTSGGVITRNGASTTMGALHFNDSVEVVVSDRAGTAEPFLYSASRIAATGAL
jgi:hypothetical protein